MIQQIHTRCWKTWICEPAVQLYLILFDRNNWILHISHNELSLHFSNWMRWNTGQSNRNVRFHGAPNHCLFDWSDMTFRWTDPCVLTSCTKWTIRCQRQTNNADILSLRPVKLPKNTDTNFYLHKEIPDGQTVSHFLRMFKILVSERLWALRLFCTLYCKGYLKCVKWMIMLINGCLCNILP